MPATRRDQLGLVPALIGDGRPLLTLTGLGLILAGLFGLFLSATGEFLPHDIHYLGMSPRQLCALKLCRVVHFMIHDRASFGGSIIAVGVLYVWLAEFPLRQRQAWAWRLLLLSGGVGFGSFLAFLSYGYLDSWHGWATLALLACFATGMVRSYPTLDRGPLLRPSTPLSFTTREGLGRLCLLAAAAGMIVGGLTIMTVGMTCVFVPQDVRYLGVTAADLNAINPRLLPLIAHDRAGFGGGVCCCGILVLGCIRYGQPSRSLWQALTVAGVIGFATAIGVHPLVGYIDAVHLAPAVLGATVYAAGLALTYRPMMCRDRSVYCSRPL